MILIGLLFIILAALTLWFPAILLCPALLLFTWFGLVLLGRGCILYLNSKRKE